MTIEINEPKTEALLKKWMDTGRFRTPEEMIVRVLETAKMPEIAESPLSGTGADIFAALQACPYPDFMDEIERPVMPVRDFEW